VSNLPVGRDRERALSATTREDVCCGGCESNPRAKSCRRRAGVHNEVGSTRSAKMPDIIQKTTLQILLMSSETATSSDSFSSMIEDGIIAIGDPEHMQRDVRVMTANMLP
jgi:hypothetical protein